MGKSNNDGKISLNIQRRNKKRSKIRDNDFDPTKEMQQISVYSSELKKEQSGGYAKKEDLEKREY